MVLSIFMWIPLIVILIATGWVPLRRFAHLYPLERVGTSFVLGATLLPFLFFLLRSLTHIALFGSVSASILMIFLFLGSILVFWFSKNQVYALFVRPSRHHAKLPRILWWILILCLFIFIGDVIYGLTQPIFGWDEYSFWLYAAKIITIHHGSTTAMLKDAYNTYPLGFPYLIAISYQWIGGISITTAKIVSAWLTLFMLISLYSLLRRLGISSLLSMLALTITVFGSQIFLWYNFLAFGEMAYVDTYVLGVFYLVAFLEQSTLADLMIAGMLLGLSCFLRVDGIYIAFFTLVLALFFTKTKVWKSLLTKKTIGSFVAYTLPPILVWQAFLQVFHTHGWTTRITVREITSRLAPHFLTTMLFAIWNTISNVSIYPIMIAFAVLLLGQIFWRRRSTGFLTLLVVAQISYLFVAYLTVFSTFEALHASSMDRYLLRIDPLIAVAFILWIGLASPRNQNDAK